jgi:hypothetical protein
MASCGDEGPHARADGQAIDVPHDTEAVGLRHYVIARLYAFAKHATAGASCTSASVGVTDELHGIIARHARARVRRFPTRSRTHLELRAERERERHRRIG